MEVTNTFEDGMKTDFSHSNQPQRSYTYCLNGINISDTGDIFALTNERGTVNRVTNFPTGFKIIGGTVLNTDLIVLLTNPTGPYSQIGIINSSFNYTRIAPNSDINNDLGLDIQYQVDAVARKLFTGDRILYFTDNNQPIGYLNLDNPPATLAGNTSLFPQVSSASVNFINISELGGNLHCGVYQFVVRYRTAELNTTAFGLISNVIPIVDENRSAGRNQYDGGYPTYPATVNKSINLSITNIDTDFPFIELIAIRFDGFSNEIKVEALPLINVTGNTTISYVYTGDDSESTYLTLDEVSQIPIIYETAKCIEQKDGRLILSNLGYTTESYNFQTIANNIIMKYVIEELEYSDGYTGNPTLTFGVSDLPYIAVVSQWNIYIKFTEQVDSATALTLTNYNVNYDPSDSPAHVVGPDYLLDDGVTASNKVYICIQAAGSGANAPTGAATDNTWWKYISPYIINPTSAEIDADDASLVILTMDITVPTQVIVDGYEVEILNVQNYDLSSTIVTTSETIIVSGADDTVLTASFNDYKNEERTYNMKGYQREEVYSLAMGVLWKDGSRSFAYPIPGSDHITATTTAANTGTKVLGTYVSTADYPTGQGYLTGKVRHHKMPTLAQEPHYRIDPTSGRTYIRILGLDFTNVVIPADIQPDIDRIFFVRQSRSNPSNRSILAQGLINNMQRVANEFDSNNGNVKAESRVYKKTPFFNNFAITESDLAPTSSSGALAMTPDSAKFEFDSADIVDNVAAFFSPDTILKQPNVSEYSKLKNVLTITGNVVREFIPSKNRNINQVFNRSWSLRNPLRAWLFGNYTNTGTTPVPTVLDIQESQFIQTGERRVFSDLITDYPIDNAMSGKFLCIKTSGTIPNGNPNQYVLNLENTSEMGGPFTEETYPNLDTLTGSDSLENYLFNIYKDNNTQYGQVGESEYILVHSSTNVAVTSYNSIFNGDTFISRFAFGNKDIYNYRSLYYTEATELHIPHALYYGNPPYFLPLIPGFDDHKGLDLRTLSYFFVESTINCDYRHQYNDGTSTGISYFPKAGYHDTLNEDPRNGDSNSYNTQYSFENAVQLFYTKPNTFSDITRFETRSVYSEESNEDDVVDNYRVFLPNSYYDLPKNTGEIWDSFVSNNTLYLHTPKSLWRTFFNDVVQQANDIGQTILGTGGIFSLPSIEVVTTDGGYAGTISQYGGANTPFGYIFPDALQGKIFLLNQGLQEISVGNSRYFASNLGSGLVSGSIYLDNPSNPSSVGILGVYDFDRKRYVITKRGGSTSFTKSCSLLNPSKPTWLSDHSYMAHMYYSINDNMFGFDNSGATTVMHEHNVGAYGVYYGAAVQPFTFEFVVNENPIVEKLFENLYLYTEAYNNGNFLELETFKSIRCTNTKKDTGTVTLTCTNLFNDTSNVKKKADRFQLAVPRNSLGSSAMFRDKMKGQWMVVRLSYPNANNYKLLVNFINSSLRQVSR